jgi:hypothetical protein
MECENEIRQMRELVEREQKSLLKIPKEEHRSPVKPKKTRMEYIYQKLFAVRGERKGRLRLSRPNQVNIYDEEEQNVADYRFTKPVVLFSKVQEHQHGYGRDTLEFSFDSKEEYGGEELVERNVKDDQKIRRGIDKAHEGFEVSSNRMMTRIGGAFGELTDECKAVRAFVQEQKRFVGKTALECQQKALELQRSLQSSLGDMQRVHRTAISAVDERQRGFVVPMRQTVGYAPQRYPIVRGYGDGLVGGYGRNDRY